MKVILNLTKYQAAQVIDKQDVKPEKLRAIEVFVDQARSEQMYRYYDDHKCQSQWVQSLHDTPSKAISHLSSSRRTVTSTRLDNAFTTEILHPVQTTWNL